MCTYSLSWKCQHDIKVNKAMHDGILTSVRNDWRNNLIPHNHMLTLRHTLSPRLFALVMEELLRHVFALKQFYYNIDVVPT